MFRSSSFSSPSFASVVSAALVVGLVAASGSAVAGFIKSRVRGKISDTGDGAVKGKFKMQVKTRGESDKDRLWVKVKKLDVGEGEELPTYDVWLLDGDDLEADFGDLDLTERGKGVLRWNSRSDDYPRGVDSLIDFAGGTIEIRDADGNAVADGSIPDFIGLEDDNEEGSKARTVGKDKAKLRPTDDGGNASGRMLTRYANNPGGVQQNMKLTVRGLDASAGPYTAVTIDDEDAETELGEFETFSRRGVGGLRLNTRDEDEIPGDNVLDLAGQDVEVRDSEGTVVLTGSFPEI